MMMITLILVFIISSVQSSPIGVDHFTAGPPLIDEEFNSPPIYYNGESSVRLFKHSTDFYQGDIKLGSDVEKNGIVSPSGWKRWSKAKIPYVISVNYTNAERRVIASAMNKFHTATCIRFIPRTNNDVDYVILKKTGEGCWSHVGRNGGGQTVSLDDDGCVFTDIVQHELMHAAGFWHEQSRYDRDDYVTINWDNIIPDLRSNFNKYSAARILLMGTRYNYRSIMHYGSYDFAIDRSKPTITAINGKKTKGTVFTQEDVTKLNRMYNCNPTECWDDDPRTGSCTQKVASGLCESSKVEMMVRCRKSCNFCNTSTTTTTIKPPITDQQSSTSSEFPSTTSITPVIDEDN